MPKYRLRPKKSHYLRGPGSSIIPMKVGEIIELTKREFSTIRDKFELVVDGDQEEVFVPAADNFELRPTGDGRYWVIRKDTQTAINDDPLEEDAANALLAKVN